MLDRYCLSGLSFTALEELEKEIAEEKSKRLVDKYSEIYDDFLREWNFIRSNYPNLTFCLESNDAEVTFLRPGEWFLTGWQINK